MIRLRFTLGFCILIGLGSCSEKADYRLRALDEFERITASKDYDYLWYRAQMSERASAVIRSAQKMVEGRPAPSLERIDTTFRGGISDRIQSGDLFILEPGTRLKRLGTPNYDISEPILKLRVMEGEQRDRIVYYSRHCIEEL